MCILKIKSDNMYTREKIQATISGQSSAADEGNKSNSLFSNKFVGTTD